MTSNESGLSAARRFLGLLALSLTLALGLASPSQAAKRTSPEDRARFVSIAHSLEAAPLDPSLTDKRAWALKWITDAPDIAVGVCTESLGGLPPDDYPYVGELTVQYLLSMAAYIIEHPDAAEDDNAQQLAGVEGALKAYGAVVAAKPDGRLPQFDDLLAAQARGELPGLVSTGFAACTSRK